MRQPRPEDVPLVERIIARLAASKRTLATGHVNADPDAVGAAIAIAETFPNVSVGAFEGLNKSAKRLVERLGYHVVIDPRVQDFETVVVCDATSPSQLKCKDPALYRDAVFIDHHQPSNFAGTSFYWSDWRFRATCEMALYLVRRSGRPLTEKAQVALLTGFITDTGRFKYNDEDVFGSVRELLYGDPAAPPRPGVYQYARDISEESDRDPSMVIAQLKGLQRAQWERAGDFFLAWTAVSAFESNCSALLLSAGADVAVAFSEWGRRLRGSSRASRAALSAGLNLGVLYRDFKLKDSRVGWDGGGHAAAAGFTAERINGGGPAPLEGRLSPWAEEVRKEVVAAIAAALKDKTAHKGAPPPPWDASTPAPDEPPGSMG